MTARAKTVALVVVWGLSSLVYLEVSYGLYVDNCDYFVHKEERCTLCGSRRLVPSTPLRLLLLSPGVELASDEAAGCPHDWRPPPPPKGERTFIDRDRFPPLAHFLAIPFWVAALIFALRARFAGSVLMPRKAAPWIVLAVGAYVLVCADTIPFLVMIQRSREAEAAGYVLELGDICKWRAWAAVYLWHAAATALTFGCGAAWLLVNRSFLNRPRVLEE